MRRFFYLLATAVAAIAVWFFTRPVITPKPTAIVQRITAGERFALGPLGVEDTPRSCEGAEAFVTLDHVAVVDTPLLVEVRPEGALVVPPLVVPQGATRVKLRLKGQRLGPAQITLRTATQRCEHAHCPTLRLSVIGGRGCQACGDLKAAPTCGGFTLRAKGCAGFEPALRVAFEARTAQQIGLGELACTWDLPECARPCGGDNVPPRLPKGYAATLSAKASEGGWRVGVQLSGPSGSRAVPVPAWAHCDLLSRLRRAATVAKEACGEVGPAPISVGRDCPELPAAGALTGQRRRYKRGAWVQTRCEITGGAL